MTGVPIPCTVLSGEQRLSGAWPAGDLVGLPQSDWPVLAPLTRLDDCDCESAECRVVGVGRASALAVHEIDWAARCGRAQLGVASPDDSAECLQAALSFVYETLNLRRVWGYVTGGHCGEQELLIDAGLRQEARLTGVCWQAGGWVDREIWGGLREHRHA